MIPIWLDCDPGHDDAVAILLAAKLPSFKLLGISTVFGNAPLEKTTVNAMAVLKAIGEDSGIKVYPGADKIQSSDNSVSNKESGSSTTTSEKHSDEADTSASSHNAESCARDHYETAPSTFAPSIHGESGLDGTSLLPEVTVKIEPHLDSTLVAMATAIRENPGTCLIATGSLTNVSALFNRFPDVKNLVETVSIMGGGFGMGNWTPYAEFNIWCDAEAARNVITDPIVSSKIMLCPLNVTHTAIATTKVLDQIKSVGGNVSQMFFELMTFFKETYETEFGFKDGPPVHDPLSVAVLLKDIVLKERKVKVNVTVDGEERGMLTEETGGQLTVVEEVDLKKFWALVVQCLESCK
ncbi:hypothetical protein CJU90_5128 [Yarrowia sp. C11]|nr:hypothetical protein CJU90_5128 [Yarrowia sp. C11]KAG5364928.1 hypothetical protein CKK34_3756 [Yarrowia sp. E02]